MSVWSDDFARKNGPKIVLPICEIKGIIMLFGILF